MSENVLMIFLLFLRSAGLLRNERQVIKFRFTLKYFCVRKLRMTSSKSRIQQPAFLWEQRSSIHTRAEGEKKTQSASRSRANTKARKKCHVNKCLLRSRERKK